MDWEMLSPPILKNLQEVVGYLNFSSGVRDPKFLHSFNELFGWMEASTGQRRPQSRGSKASKSRSGRKGPLQESEGESPTWLRLGRWLQAELPQLSER
ncbi:MAG TPA: hypothetical protein PLQ00_06360, partial [Thermoguttaceae bacterium]|nr:hypothetical protein [Thermoguttaceae bacterium]